MIDKFLSCTVGGAPQPIVVSLCKHKPARVVFFASPETRDSVEDIVQSCAEQGFILGSGARRVVAVASQDFEECVAEMERTLRAECDDWTGSGREIILDFTGGTKLMTAALALVGHRLPCLFSYVAAKQHSDGTSARTKEGVGITLDGQENVLRLRNPWDVLGHQTFELARQLFNRGSFAAARTLCCEHRNKTEADDLKRQLATLGNLFSAYARWNAFDHTNALKELNLGLRGFADLEHWLSDSRRRELRAAISRHIDFLQTIGAHPSQAWVLDLLSNACRCAEREAFEDAVARLYRAIEAYAQWRLSDRKIDTAAVRRDQLPDSLCEKWNDWFREETIKLGLQDDYTLLGELGDAAGERFTKLGLALETSPLLARNNSILAHGFRPATKNSFEALFQPALNLTEIIHSDLIKFPSL